jgi:hypothetical protein
MLYKLKERKEKVRKEKTRKEKEYLYVCFVKYSIYFIKIQLYV